MDSKIEKKIHEGLDDARIRDNREFFNTTPEQAKSILEIAEIMGGKDVTPKGDIVETAQDKQALENAKKQKRYDFAYLKMALEWAKLSYCSRKQVGALIVKDQMIISDGYNGTPTGLDNSCEDDYHKLYPAVYQI